MSWLNGDRNDSASPPVSTSGCSSLFPETADRSSNSKASLTSNRLTATSVPTLSISKFCNAFSTAHCTTSIQSWTSQQITDDTFHNRFHGSQLFNLVIYNQLIQSTGRQKYQISVQKQVKDKERRQLLPLELINAVLRLRNIVEAIWMHMGSLSYLHILFLLNTTCSTPSEGFVLKIAWHQPWVPNLTPILGKHVSKQS